jgi:hypothetical protein
MTSGSTHNYLSTKCPTAGTNSGQAASNTTTEVGGSFKSCLQARRLERFFESHPRKWVDRSSPAYKRRRLDRFFESHPRKWVDCSSPAYK